MHCGEDKEVRREPFLITGAAVEDIGTEVSAGPLEPPPTAVLAAADDKEFLVIAGGAEEAVFVEIWSTSGIVGGVSIAMVTGGAGSPIGRARLQYRFKSPRARVLT